MTIDEFSYEFDVLASSYLLEGGFTVSDSSLFAFNEYEKSLFLTNAQEQYVLSLYNGKNTAGDRFEGTEEVRRYLHNLIAEYTANTQVDSTIKNYLDKRYYGISTINTPYKSALFALPDDLWFITYESVLTKADGTRAACDGKYSIAQDVVPVTLDEFHRIKRNPFRGPSYRRALRLDLSDANLIIEDKNGNEQAVPNNGVVEIVSKYDIDSYYIRYIKRLEPIILVDLPLSLSINEKSKAQGCMIHEAAHRDILELAVRLAIASRQLNNANNKTKDNN